MSELPRTRAFRRRPNHLIPKGFHRVSKTIDRLRDASAFNPPGPAAAVPRMRRLVRIEAQRHPAILPVVREMQERAA